jgi:hypothetical protein
MFDYEKLLYDALLVPENSNPLNHDFKHNHLWAKKATGLGVTELMLRLMVWLCLRDDTYGNSQMCIVTGPNQDNRKDLDPVDIMRYGEQEIEDAKG